MRPKLPRRGREGVCRRDRVEILDHVAWKTEASSVNLPGTVVKADVKHLFPW